MLAGATTVWLAGWVVIVGATNAGFTVRIAAELVTEVTTFVTTTV
jgi:hypothetical protein